MMKDSIPFLAHRQTCCMRHRVMPSQHVINMQLEVSDKADPPMFKVSDTHYAATWLLDPRAPKVEMPQELKARLERMKKEAKDYGSEL